MSENNANRKRGISKYLAAQRRLKAPMGKLVSFYAIAISVWHIWNLTTGIPEPMVYRTVHVGLVVSLVYALYPAHKKAPKSHIPWYDILCIIGSISSIAYLHYDFDRIIMRYAYVSPVETLDYLFGIMLVLLVLEAVRRCFGPPLALVAVFAIIHALLGHRFPWVFRHSGVSITRLIDQLYLIPSGMFGTVTALSATYVFAFILLGACYIAVGADEFFMNMATAATKNTVGGPAKTSSIGSALFAMVSGSTVANVYTTGTITIPLMKRAGFKSYFAGAVEAAASTCGQWMPPAMGSSAFLIAEFTGLGYVRVMGASILPAALYVLSVYFSIHYRALKNDLGKYTPPGIENINLKSEIKEWGLMITPLIVLLILLLLRYSAFYSALLAAGSILVVAPIRKVSRYGLKDILVALESTANKMSSICTALVCASIILGVFELTGLPLRFTSIVIRLAAGRLLVALLLISLAAVFLGMGLPTAAAYVITMIFGVPALEALGVAPLTGHMFVFYFATLSSITPPVCTASFAASSVADSPPMKTGFEGVKLAIVAYILPFVVVYNPSLLMEGNAFQIVGAFVTTGIAAMSFASLAQNYLISSFKWLERILILLGALLLIFPGLNILTILGGGAVLTGLIIHTKRVCGHLNFILGLLSSSS